MEGQALAMFPHSFVRERLSFYAEQVKHACPPDAESHIDRVARARSSPRRSHALYRRPSSFLACWARLSVFCFPLPLSGTYRRSSHRQRRRHGRPFSSRRSRRTSPVRCRHGATSYSCSVFGLIGSLIIGFLHSGGSPRPKAATSRGWNRSTAPSSGPSSAQPAPKPLRPLPAAHLETFSG